MDPSSLARALDARIDDERRAGSAERDGAPAMPAREGDAATQSSLAEQTAWAELAELDELTALAAALDVLPKPPAPEAAFRASLAARLALAPAPSTVSAAAGPAPVLSTAQLSQAFDASLVALAAGLPREDALALLGEAAGDGDLTDLVGLAASLYELPDTPSPRASFRAQLQGALAAAPEPRSLRQAVRPTLWSRLGQRVWQSTKLMAGAAAAVILFAGAGVTFASANALPGDALYPVKRTTERAQLWLGGEADALRHHLAFADRRLDEAVARPPLAGLTLSEFNREVTAALAAADASVARQVPREVVIDPLLRWLLGARGDLIAGRPVLPPMAWRGARALVDEAILALDGGRPLAERTVPRLAHPDAVLALRAETGQPWAHRPATNDPALSPIVADVRLRPAGASDADLADEAVRRAASARAAAARLAASAAVDPNAGSVTAPGSTGAIDARSADPRGSRPPASDPRPTSRPAKPSPSAEPTRERPSPTRDAPTEPPAPSEPAPTEPSPAPASPTAVEPSPVVPTAAPTDPPTAQPALPAELALACGKGDGVVEVYQSVLCTLALPDGWTLPAGWDVHWTTTSFNPPEDPELEPDGAEPWRARYTPKIALAGSLKMLVTLDATVRDADGRAQAAGKAKLFVVPRNHNADGASEGTR